MGEGPGACHRCGKLGMDAQQRVPTKATGSAVDTERRQPGRLPYNLQGDEKMGREAGEKGVFAKRSQFFGVLCDLDWLEGERVNDLSVPACHLASFVKIAGLCT